MPSSRNWISPVCTPILSRIGANGAPDMFKNAARVIVGGYLFWYFTRTLFRLSAVDGAAVSLLLFVTVTSVRLLLMYAAKLLGIPV